MPDPGDGRLLQACLNGARLPCEHPRLPVTATALAREATKVHGAGVDAVHLHVNDHQGVDTLDAAAMAEVLEAARADAPGVVVGVATGAWVLPDRQARVQAIREWTILPDFASVNWHETGAEDVAAALLERGVGVEAGLWHAEAMADRLLDLLGPGPGLPVLLHGQGNTCWPTLRHAARLGLPTRIGLEDTLTMPDGSRAPDNTTLVEAASAILAENGS
jgi:uncharacterized protein (DUF849 family)